MGKSKKKPMNGDSKLIYDAVIKLQADVSDIKTEVASETATRGEQHSANIRSLESMSGDMHIVLSKVQELPCKGESERINGLKTNIAWLWTILSGVGLLVAGAFIKHVMAG